MPFKVPPQVTRMDADDGPHTMGIENFNGTKAVVVPGRNATADWSALNESVAFVPSGVMVKLPKPPLV